jgi:hypothetical protein
MLTSFQIEMFLGFFLWLGWPCLTKKNQSKQPRPSTPPSKSVLAAGKTSS